MWKCFSSFDHFPPVETPLQYVPSLLLRHLSEWSYGVLAAEFSSYCKVSSFPSTKGVSPWLNFPVSHDHCRTLFFCRANICSCSRYRNWIRAGKMAWTVDDNRPVNFVRFKTEVFGCAKISWYCWDTCFNFFSERAKVNFSVPITKPRNSICFTGWRTNFLRLITKPKCCNRKINVSHHENFWYCPSHWQVNSDSNVDSSQEGDWNF